MSVPYSLMMIKPMSVGRGDAPLILADTLHDCPVALRMFRSWVVCDSTLVGLCRMKGMFESGLDYDVEKIHPLRQVHSWVCVFTHLDRKTDPTPILNDYCGPLDPTQLLPSHLRSKYGGYARVGKTAHASDTVVHIAKTERVDYEGMLLFMDFDETKI